MSNALTNRLFCSPLVNSTFQNLIRNTCYSKIVNREASNGFNQNIQKLLEVIDDQKNELSEAARRLMLMSLHEISSFVSI